MTRAWIFVAMLAAAPAMAGPPSEAEVAKARSAAIEAEAERAWRSLAGDRAAPPECTGADGSASASQSGSQSAEPISQSTSVALDVDPSPGVEQVIASRRWGVIVRAAGGRPLGSIDLGCPTSIAVEPVRATGRAPADLAVRLRLAGRCGWTDRWVLLGRAPAGRALTPLLTIDIAADRACAAAPAERFDGRIEITPGQVRAVLDGHTQDRRPDGDLASPVPLHRTLIWRLGPDGRFTPAK